MGDCISPTVYPLSEKATKEGYSNARRQHNQYSQTKQKSAKEEKENKQTNKQTAPRNKQGPTKDILEEWKWET